LSLSLLRLFWHRHFLARPISSWFPTDSRIQAPPSVRIFPTTELLTPPLTRADRRRDFFPQQPSLTASIYHTSCPPAFPTSPYTYSSAISPYLYVLCDVPSGNLDLSPLRGSPPAMFLLFPFFAPSMHLTLSFFVDRSIFCSFQRISCYTPRFPSNLLTFSKQL